MNMRNILADLLDATEDVKPRGKASMTKPEAKQHAAEIVALKHQTLTISQRVKQSRKC
jgi:hypothetical protein